MNWTSDHLETDWQATIGAVNVRFGAGRLAETGAVAADVGIARPLLVTDPGVRASGHADSAAEALEAAGLAVAVFDEVSPNPTEVEVDRGARAAATHGADGLVAVGGGSAMDCAKGINFVATNGGSMVDYRGYGKPRRPLLPSVGVPTTAGTGSEAQSYALISDSETGEKMACGDPGASFRAVVLDPDLPRTAPPPVVAVSGLDAISHAVESYVTTRRNPTSAEHALAAWRLLDGALETVLGSGAKDSPWAELILGAHLAGAAVEQSMLGAAHATAHGVAVMLMLPAVVRYNGEEHDSLYGELTGIGSGATESLARRLEALRDAGGLPARLRQVGVDRGELRDLARAAATQWTAGFNPRPVGAAELERLYEAAW